MKIEDIGVITEKSSEWIRMGGDEFEHRLIPELYIHDNVISYWRSAEYNLGDGIYKSIGMSGNIWMKNTIVVPTLPFLIKRFTIDVVCDYDVGFYVKSRREADEYLEYYGNY